MQEERLRLRALRVGALPILNHFIARMGLAAELTLALKNAGYADALLALIKNIVVERNALYAVGEWAALYDVGLVAQGKVGDDRLGRALDRLFAADRATLQTRIVLAAIKGFELKMQEIHNDTTSVMVRGAYDGQNPKAVQLKRGHSKERRPDLKQLVYSLCITADGAVPVHFKAYDGNQTDDGIHLETWNRLRTLLQRHLLNEPLAFRSPAIETGHLGGGAGLINEDKSFRIKGWLCFPQGLTSRDDVFPILLRGVYALFLKVKLRWWRNREIADLLTFTFSFASRALSSASVLSGCSATNALTRSACGARVNVLCPPNLPGSTLPVSRLRLMNRPTVLKAKLYSSATSSRA